MNRFDSLSRGSRITLLACLCLLGLLLIALLAEGAVRVRQLLRHGAAIRIESLYHVDPESGLRVPVAGFTSEKINMEVIEQYVSPVEPGKHPAMIYDLRRRPASA